MLKIIPMDVATMRTSRLWCITVCMVLRTSRAWLPNVVNSAGLDRSPKHVVKVMGRWEERRQKWTKLTRFGWDKEYRSRIFGNQRVKHRGGGILFPSYSDQVQRVIGAEKTRSGHL